MADQCNAMFWLPFLISVAGKQLGEYLICTRLALFLRLKRTIPPAGLVQIVRQCQRTKVFHEIRARPTRQDLEVGFVHTGALRCASLVAAAVDASFFMNLFPRDQGNIQSLCDRGSGERGAFHQAGVEMSQTKTIAVLDIPFLIICNRLMLFQEFCQEAGLFVSIFCQGGVWAFLIVRVVPVCVVCRLSMPDEIQFHNLCTVTSLLIFRPL